MSLKTANEISENELESITGGLQRTNTWGNGSKYKIGMLDYGYAYTFDTSRASEVDGIISGLKITPDMTQAQIERMKLEALKAVPGLLTAIPDCDPSWY